MSWLNPFAPYLAAGTLALVVFGGVQTYRIGNLKNDVNVANGKVQALTDANKALSEKREAERHEAQTSYNKLSTTCTADMLASLKTGRLIERITNAPAPSNGTRGRVSASVVRQIFTGTEPVGQTRPVSR